MARVVMFAYVLLAGLATPALLFAAGGSGEGTPPAPGPGAGSSTTTTTSTTPAPKPAPPPSPSSSPAQTRTVPETRVASKSVAAAAHPKPTARPAAHTRAIAHAAGSATISDFKYTPSTVTVSVGETVTWSNQGPTGHSATADDGSFDTGVLSRGGSGSHTFTQAGTFTFHCRPHPFMKGKVIVTAASSGGGTASSAGAGGGSAAGGGETGSGTGSSGSAGSATGTDPSAGSSLPNTGADVGAVALLGAILLGGGIVLRRRLAEPE